MRPNHNAGQVSDWGHNVVTDKAISASFRQTIVADNSQPSGFGFGMPMAPHFNGYVVGNYYGPGIISIQRTTLSWGANQILYSSFYCVKTTTFDRMRFYTNQVTNGEIRLAIYNADGTNMQPNSLLLDAGTAATTGAAGDKTITISQELKGNTYYWLALNCNATTTVIVHGNGAYFVRDVDGPAAGSSKPSYYSLQTYGAFPSTAPSLNVYGSGAEIQLRAA